MKINEITINPTTVLSDDPARFRVGDPVVEGGHIVEKIVYHPSTRLFNKGLEVGQGVYAIYFNDIPERRLIMENTVTSVEAVKEKKTTTSESEVELPE